MVLGRTKLSLSCKNGRCVTLWVSAAHAKLNYAFGHHNGHKSAISVVLQRKGRVYLCTLIYTKNGVNSVRSKGEDLTKYSLSLFTSVDHLAFIHFPQEWFGKGGAPFIGIIVSPYNYSNVSNQSQIRCLTVSDEWESAGQYRLPYQFDYEVFGDEADEDDTVEQVRSIADDYRRYPL